MSRTLANHVQSTPTGGGPAAAPLPQELLPRRPHDHDETDLLEQVRDNLVRIIAEVEQHPRSVRVAVGSVSVEVEWAVEHVTVTAAVPVPAPAPAAPQPPAPAEAPAVPGPVLTAPTVGMFFRAPQPGAAPFVAEGDVVAVGQQVGIVEAMKLMIPVQADAAGVVAEVLKGDGEPVEYGEPLFALSTAG